jgi:choice-of-anchor A domain-containing protein
MERRNDGRSVESGPSHVQTCRAGRSRGQAKRDRFERRHGDRGNTLVEIVVVVGVLGILSTAVAGAISVVFRTDAGVTSTIAASHDVQQVINYFEADVHSAPATESSWAFAGSGCEESGSDNLFRYDSGPRRIAYQAVQSDGATRIDRYRCTLVDSVWLEDSVLNVVDSLSQQPTVTIATQGSTVEQVVLNLSFPDRTVEVPASPRSSTAVAAAALDGVCGADPTEADREFGGFILGDVTLNGGTVDGTLAVGGVLTWSADVQLSRTDQNQAFQGVALYAEEIAFGTGGHTLTVDGGDVVLGGTFYEVSDRSREYVFADSSESGDVIDVKKSVFDLGFAPDIDFEESTGAFEACSHALVQIPDSESTVIPRDGSCTGAFTGSGDLCLELTAGTRVLTIPDSVLTSVTSLSLTGGGLSQAQPLVINVIDDDGDGLVVIDLSGTSWNQIGQAKNVIWNFPNTDQLVIQSELLGTILAPLSDLVTNGGVTGAIVAQDWIHNSGVVQNDGDNQFDSTIDWGD